MAALKTEQHINDKVMWFSDDYAKCMTGKIIGINTEQYVGKTTTVTYEVEADETIKGSNKHFIDPSDLLP